MIEKRNSRSRRNSWMLSLMCLKCLNAATNPYAHTHISMYQYLYARMYASMYVYIYRTEESNILRSCDFIYAKYISYENLVIFFAFPHLI